MSGLVQYLFNEMAHSGGTKSRVEIQGNIAADPLGKATNPDSIHVTLVVSDSYSGVTMLDGQPTSWGLDCLGMCLNTRIRSGFSGKGVVWGPFDVSTPDGMSTTQFGQSLVSTAAGYQNNLVPYSLPLNSAGILPRGGWNSGSWVSGLLQTVGGYAPQYNFSPFIAPGYSNPVPGRVYGDR